MTSSPHTGEVAVSGEPLPGDGERRHASGSETDRLVLLVDEVHAIVEGINTD